VKEVLKEIVKHKSHIGNGFVLFYVALSIALLTLNPFDLEAFKASEAWVWRFSVEDFSRNILLFFPFGLMLRHSYRWPHITALFLGLLLSGCVEIGQLFMVERTSNFVDLISNSSGALLGSIVYQRIFRSSVYSFTVPFLFVLVPLCWDIALVSSFRPNFVWAIVPCVVAGLAVFRLIALPSLRRRIALAIWVIAAILPLINTSPTFGVLLPLSVPVMLYGLSKVEKSYLPITVVTLLSTSFVMVLQQIYVWYVSIEDWAWTWENHLSWITVLKSILTIGSSVVWYRLEKSPKVCE